MGRNVGGRIEGIAAEARTSSRGKSRIIDLRLYVHEKGSGAEGFVSAIRENGSLGEELPLSDHSHFGQVVQQVVDIVRKDFRATTD